MKRSEAIEKLKQFLLNKVVGYDVMDHLNPDDCETDYPLKDAMVILEFVEESLKMIPSEIGKFAEYGTAYYPNEWEPEGHTFEELEKAVKDMKKS